MFRFFLKVVVGFNTAYLFHGYINGKFHKSEESILIDTKNHFKYEEFDKNFENFKINNPQYVEYPEQGRKEIINELKNEKFDILVIGGGCNGAGVLLESHRRGLKTGLIELNDFASGTSSRSTKLIHGGIRYLQDTFALSESNRWEKFKLVFEALVERDFLVNSVPYMNSLLQIKIPFTNFFKMDYYFSGIYVYQLLYFLNNFPNVYNTFPWPELNLKEKTMSFYEGQMFDARQCILTLLTCTRINNINKTKAVCANYVEFIEYIYESKTGKIKGIKAFDCIEKKFFTISAECIVNCTGIFADKNLNKEDKFVDKLIRASKGTHIILDKNYVIEKMRIDSGYMVPNTTDGRVLFILPYQNDYFIVGTTDEEMKKTLTPEVEEKEIDYLKNELRIAFNLDSKELSNEIKSKWAGLRPLVLVPSEKNSSKSEDLNTKSLARNHIIRVDKNTGLVTLMGGKWTTYRKMGMDVLEEIKKDPQFKIISDKMQETKSISKFTGAIHMRNIEKENSSYFDEKIFFSQFTIYLIHKYSVSERIAKDLVFKYGLNAYKILEINNRIKDKEKYILRENEQPILKAELIFCIKYELVEKPNDFICRRNGISFVNEERSLKIVDEVTNLLGKELNWGKDRIKKEKEEALRNLKYNI